MKRIKTSLSTPHTHIEALCQFLTCYISRHIREVIWREKRCSEFVRLDLIATDGPNHLLLLVRERPAKAFACVAKRHVSKFMSNREARPRHTMVCSLKNVVTDREDTRNGVERSVLSKLRALQIALKETCGLRLENTSNKVGIELMVNMKRFPQSQSAPLNLIVRQKRHGDPSSFEAGSPTA